MSIDTATAARVAKLARIRLRKTRFLRWRKSSTQSGFIEQLNEVDVEGVEPMTSVTPQRLKRRVDGDRREPTRQSLKTHQMRVKDFVVPKVVE